MTQHFMLKENSGMVLMKVGSDIGSRIEIKILFLDQLLGLIAAQVVLDQKVGFSYNENKIKTTTISILSCHLYSTTMGSQEDFMDFLLNYSDDDEKEEEEWGK